MLNFVAIRKGINTTPLQALVDYVLRVAKITKITVYSILKYWPYFSIQNNKMEIIGKVKFVLHTKFTFDSQSHQIILLKWSKMSFKKTYVNNSR